MLPADVYTVRANVYRGIPMGARSTRDVIADATAARARARVLVRQAEEVRRESAALLNAPLLVGRIAGP